MHVTNRRDFNYKDKHSEGKLVYKGKSYLSRLSSHKPPVSLFEPMSNLIISKQMLGMIEFVRHEEKQIYEFFHDVCTYAKFC